MGVAVSILIGLTFLGSAVVALPNLAVEWARHQTPEVVFSVEVPQPMIALTIDDGPSPATPEILRVLDEHDAQATFFLIGDRLDERPEGARAILRAGHEIGHHMMEDRPSRELPEDEFEASFDAMDHRLDGLGGTRLFRPGSGWYDDRMVSVAADRGYRTVLGSVYPFDAQISSDGFASWYVLQNVVPGSVVVLHDGADRGRRTADVLRSVLPTLRQRGYRIVGVSTLLNESEGVQAPPLESGSVDLNHRGGR